MLGANSAWGFSASFLVMAISGLVAGGLILLDNTLRGGELVERATVAVLTDPETRERLRTAGAAVVADGSLELTKHIVSETAMWRDVIAKAGIKVE